MGDSVWYKLTQPSGVFSSQHLTAEFNFASFHEAKTKRYLFGSEVKAKSFPGTRHLIGFFNCLCFIRLLTLWFDYGHWPEVYEALVEGIKTIQIDTWLQVGLVSAATSFLTKPNTKKPQDKFALHINKIFIPNRTFLVRFGGISGELGQSMVRILARSSRAKLPMARPNEPNMPPKRAKKLRYDEIALLVGYLRIWIQ